MFVGSSDHNLYAVDAVTGKKRWAYTTGSAVESSPEVSRDGSTVFVGSNDGNLHAIAVDVYSQNSRFVDPS